MKTLFSLSILIVTFCVLIFIGCQSHDPVAPNQQEQQLSGADEDFSRKPIKIGEGTVGNSYPQNASLELIWFAQQNGYSSGNMNFLNGSKLYVSFDALTPPPGTPQGDPVMIGGLIEMDTLNNELLFSFGPSGCQFDPPADLWMKYGDLGNGNPTLYYIDANGNYIEQQPYSISQQQKWMQVKIQHFSRYAIAISR